MDVNIFVRAWTRIDKPKRHSDATRNLQIVEGAIVLPRARIDQPKPPIDGVRNLKIADASNSNSGQTYEKADSFLSLIDYTKCQTNANRKL